MLCFVPNSKVGLKHRVVLYAPAEIKCWHNNNKYDSSIVSASTNIEKTHGVHNLIVDLSRRRKERKQSAMNSTVLRLGNYGFAFFF